MAAGNPVKGVAMKKPLVISLLCLASACARVSYGQTGPVLPPKPEGTPIPVVVTKQPECPYDEIGMIRASAGNLEWAMEAIQSRARSAGADAILITGSGMVVSGRNTQTTATATGSQSMTTTSTTDVIDAVAIHYRCPQAASPPVPISPPASAP
jgi:hypothetical protein